jgi:SAM-dependent methyltransferase
VPSAGPHSNVAARAGRSLWLRALDARDRVAGRTDPLTPPRRLSDWVGDRDFQAVGDHLLHEIAGLAGLRPDEHVLDVGCGIGRLARPLTHHLAAEGGYDGFDIVASAIEWCQEHYSAFPNFHFQHADVRSTLYNPEGRLQAATFHFPYAGEQFEVVAMTSLLTHLVTTEAEHYIDESARVLRGGGRLFATAFLLEDESRAHLERGDANVRFTGDDGRQALADPSVPASAVALDERWLRDCLEVAGLRLTPPRYGSWCGRASATGWQDTLVAVRG